MKEERNVVVIDDDAPVRHRRRHLDRKQQTAVEGQISWEVIGYKNRFRRKCRVVVAVNVLQRIFCVFFNVWIDDFMNLFKIGSNYKISVLFSSILGNINRWTWCQNLLRNSDSELPENCVKWCMNISNFPMEISMNKRWFHSSTLICFGGKKISGANHQHAYIWSNYKVIATLLLFPPWLNVFVCMGLSTNAKNRLCGHWTLDWHTNNLV